MEDKKKNFVSAVVYVHNAGERIGSFLETVISVLEENFDCSEVICVNDCSGDDSRSAIRLASGIAKTSSVSMVDMGYFHGLEMAMNAGVDLAMGDLVFEFDDTVLDYSGDVIMEVYHRALQGYDIVSASPDRREKLTSRLFYKVFDRFSDLPYKMHTESFRLLSRRAINRVTSMNKTVPYRKALYASAGLRTGTIVYKVTAGMAPLIDKKERRYRSSLAVDSLILFTEVGYRAAVTMTVLMMLVSIFMVVYSVVIYMTAHPVEGWTTTILFLSVAFFGLFGILTVIIKYLQLLVSLVFKRRQYSFASIEKLTK